MYRKKGFTLIELLVVIAIIGILSSLVLTRLSEARSRARDQKRIATARQIENALDLYYFDTGEYPRTNTYNEAEGTGWDISSNDRNGNGIYFLDFLVEGGYIPFNGLEDIFTGPEGHGGYHPDNAFMYYSYTAAQANAYGCEPRRFYVLALSLENPELASASPGFYCDHRDWEDLDDWVVGKYF